MRISAKYWQCCRGEYFPNICNVAEENICTILGKLQMRIFSKCWKVADEKICQLLTVLQRRIYVNYFAEENIF
jgi:hypothetical protein